MPNAMYPLGREKFLTAQIDWSADDIVALLVTDYDYSDVHEFIADVTLTGFVAATSPPLTGKSWAFGIADAADVIIPTVAAGPTIFGVVIAKDTGDNATSPLILFLDSTTASVQIETTPDGSDVRVRWSDGPLRIFRL